MQNNHIITGRQLTPAELSQIAINQIAQLAQVVNILKDVAFDIDTPTDFDAMYSADIKKIDEAMKINPGILADPEALTDIPLKTKKLYSVFALLNPLLPKPPGSIITN